MALARPESRTLHAFVAPHRILFLGAWAWHYAPMYLRPRVDGATG